MHALEKYIVIGGDANERLLMRYNICPDAIAWEYEQATVIWFPQHYQAQAAFAQMRKRIIERCHVNTKTLRAIYADEINIMLQAKVNFNVFNAGERRALRNQPEEI